MIGDFIRSILRVFRTAGSGTKSNARLPTMGPDGSPGGPIAVRDSVSSNSAIVPFDPGLLERTRMQWQFGDWVNLSELKRDTIKDHPERATLALFAAAGHQQVGNHDAARAFIKLAQEWGCSRKLMTRLLVAGVHNSLGKAALVIGDLPLARQHFEKSVVTGTPHAALMLATRARLGYQWSLVRGNEGRLDAHELRTGKNTSLVAAVTEEPASKVDGAPGHDDLVQDLLFLEHTPVQWK